VLFADRDIRCVDCAAMFVFSLGEQEFFHAKGFVNELKHCKQCKAKRQSGGKGKRRIETQITCSECGSNTTVPFRPTQNRPILCASCFSHRAEGNRRSVVLASKINQTAQDGFRGLCPPDCIGELPPLTPIWQAVQSCAPF
jgi:CxxC-x17-CxxC domain-containing protein